MSRQLNDQPLGLTEAGIGQSGPLAGPYSRRAKGGLVAAIAVLLATATLAVFWPVTRCDFINLDDLGYVSGNPHVRGGLNWQNVLWAFGSRLGGNWHPLTWLSFMLDVTLFGPGPRGPHLVNLLLHTTNSVLVFLLVRRMTGALWRSALVAALFALHPLRVESVAWVSERKDVLSGLFFFLTLWAYAGYAEVRSLNSKVQSPKSAGVVSRFTFHISHFTHPASRRLLWYGLALLFFAMGLMSKPMVVTLPFVLVLLDYWPLRRLEIENQKSKIKNLLLEKLPFFVLSAIGCVVTFEAQRRGGAVAEWGGFPLTARLENALVSYARYLGKTFWPVDLAVFYPPPLHWPWGAVVLATLLVVGLSLGALWAGRQRGYLLTGWFWWVGTLVPVIGLAQVGGQAMADRYTYLPAIGLFSGLVWALGEWAKRSLLRQIVAGAAGLGALVGCGLRTADQVGYWRDSETLFSHALACTSENFVTHDNLGLALTSQGKLDAAIHHFKKALEVRPGFAPAHDSMGRALAAQGKSDEAIAQWKLAIRSNPSLAEAHNSLGRALAAQGKWEEAVPHYEQAVRIRPDLAAAWNGLGDVLLGQGRLNEAIQHYQRALKADPDFAQAYTELGLALARKGHWGEAIAHYRKAAKLQPDAAQPQNNLAWVLATCPEARFRNGTQAVELAREVNRLSGGENPEYLDTLAAAYAEAGQFEQATEVGERAVALAVAHTNSYLPELRARLDLYRQRSAYHQPARKSGYVP